MCMIIWQKYPRSVGLSQHASAISSLIMDVPLHYIIQNFKRFYFLPPPQILMTQGALFPPRMDAPVYIYIHCESLKGGNTYVIINLDNLDRFL